MKLAAANKKLESIIKKVESDGLSADNLIEDLKELREYAIERTRSIGNKGASTIIRIPFRESIVRCSSSI